VVRDSESAAYLTVFSVLSWHRLCLQTGIEMMKVMNTSNPFQVPVCLQRADSQQRRRERFKRGFIATVAAMVVLLVGLLIEGCMSEQATNATGPGDKAANFPTPQPGQTLVVEQKPASSAQLSQTATLPTTASAPSEPKAAPAGHAKTIYVVKPGDTLSRIAKTHGTTVKALKTANNLENDRIVVGAKLKIPEA
jgi:LysM repeat protein